jgi:signal transduction histidine kinase
LFKGLRFRLTATYVVAALSLVLLMGLGTYGLLRFYFQSDNDAVIRYRVAIEYESLGVEIPADLAAAKDRWESRHGEVADASALPPGLALKSEDAAADDLEDDGGGGPPWKAYPDSELAPLFVLRLDSSGTLVTEASSTAEDSLSPVAESQKAALVSPDLRTSTLADGTQARVATYRLPASAVSSSQPVAYVQVGRLLSDQNRVLDQILLTVLLACAAAAVIVGFVSWYLAGRSLGPARRAWEQQQMFVANASHELRAPLTLIRASAEYALRQCGRTDAIAEGPKGPVPSEPSVAEVLKDVVTETDHLSRLVDDLLLLSRIDAGKVAMEIKPFPIAELFSDIGRSFERLAEEKGVSLHTGSDAVVVSADYTRIRQVILILLDNALRHTSPGGVITLGASAQGGKAVISVIDTGAGIAPEDLPHVFDRFYQVPTPEGGGRGSGLGLSIAQTLVQAQRGHIELFSRPGEGTRITLSLPRGDPPPPAQESACPPSASCR